MSTRCQKTQKELSFYQRLENFLIFHHSDISLMRHISHHKCQEFFKPHMDVILITAATNNYFDNYLICHLCLLSDFKKPAQMCILKNAVYAMHIGQKRVKFKHYIQKLAHHNKIKQNQPLLFSFSN